MFVLASKISVILKQEEEVWERFHDRSCTLWKEHINKFRKRKKISLYNKTVNASCKCRDCM